MNRHAMVGFIMTVAFGLSVASQSSAQDNDDLQQGLKAYGTYRGGEIDSVSMTNGGLSLDVPLASFPQRGKVSSGFKLVYVGSKNYVETTHCAGDQCTTRVGR